MSGTLVVTRKELRQPGSRVRRRSARRRTRPRSWRCLRQPDGGVA